MKAFLTIQNDFRELIVEEVNKESILPLIERVILELNRFKTEIDKMDKRATTLELEKRVEANLDSFEFLKTLATVEDENEWDDYDFDGDFESLGNIFLNHFFDICDYKINYRGFDTFCWVKL